MPSFSHIVGFALVALSLGYAVSAMPTVSNVDISIPACIGADAVSHVLTTFCAEIELKVKAMLGCNTIADLTVAVDAVCAVIKACAEALLQIGVGVKVEADAHASIVACVSAMITLLVKVCVQVTAKFGLAAVVVIFAKIDIVLRLLLVNLNICIGGILAVIAKAIVQATVGLLAQLQLKLCLGVLTKAAVGL